MHPVICIHIRLKTNASAQPGDEAFAKVVVGNLSKHKLLIDIKGSGVQNYPFTQPVS
jgi:hypothetical protein